ncbi:MAG: 2-amino-4-hydroxy-6-hydroxymethyldihydropteridine diphosphokinase [Firmicutes bacterium]|nr:2-amino-4-hydroxy-6-hydroxymethyldihydropteridine diphosphokinase [Bacillota bacterium]MCL1953716.1 2-amino-4-hydroxy-6-hydroxymethyldihydropteridine diphosphokinase [Bacillota bacterium]
MNFLDELSLEYDSVLCTIGDDKLQKQLQFDISLMLYFDEDELIEGTYDTNIIKRMIRQHFSKNIFDTPKSASVALIQKLFDSFLCFNKIVVVMSNRDTNTTYRVSRQRLVVYLGLGSNIGQREINLKKAIFELNSVGVVKRSSNFYNTKPVGPILQDDFLNAVVKLETFLLPHQLLKAVKNIEKSIGRTTTVKWGPRLIDIDILLYDDVRLHTEQLILPHQHMHKREFVLKPMLDVAPYIVHPVYNLNMTELYEFLTNKV